MAPRVGSSTTKKGTSKVSVLPKPIRDEVSKRFRNGETPLSISRWLESVGHPVSEKTLREWGGNHEQAALALRDAEKWAADYAGKDTNGVKAVALVDMGQTTLLQIFGELARRSTQIDESTPLAKIEQIMNLIQSGSSAAANLSRSDLAIQKFKLDLQKEMAQQLEKTKAATEASGRVVDPEFFDHLVTNVLGLLR